MSENHPAQYAVLYALRELTRSRVTNMRPEESEALRKEIEGLLPYVVSILAYPCEEPPIDGWLMGGSALLACSGKYRFLVTADHVIREVEVLRKKQCIDFLLGGIHAAPEEISDWEILDRDAKLDICTLSVPDTFCPSQINKTFFDIGVYAPPMANVGDRVLIVGYPAGHRVGSNNIINARCLPIQDFVTDVGPRRFTIADESMSREVAINPSRLIIPEHVGGMSGSPAFRVNDTGNVELLGVFSEGSDGLHGTYFCAHATFLCVDGRIDRSRLPPM